MIAYAWRKLEIIYRRVHWEFAYFFWVFFSQSNGGVDIAKGYDGNEGICAGDARL